MRIVVVLLLFANLTFFIYALIDRWIDSRSSGETSQQVQPDKIRLLTPQQVVALGPDKAAALSDVCVEWGPFSDADRARAVAELEPYALGRLLTQRRVDATSSAQARLGATMLVIRDPSLPVLSRLRELSSAYSNADVKVGACEK